MTIQPGDIVRERQEVAGVIPRAVVAEGWRSTLRGWRGPVHPPSAP